MMERVEEIRQRVEAAYATVDDREGWYAIATGGKAIRAMIDNGDVVFEIMRETSDRTAEETLGCALGLEEYAEPIAELWANAASDIAYLLDTLEEMEMATR